MGVAKLIEGIGKGIDFVASMVGSLTNFIDSTVEGYDNFMKNNEVLYVSDQLPQT